MRLRRDTLRSLTAHQLYQGGSVAHRLFHTHILPHVLLSVNPEGVPAEFRQRALALCEHMGGMDGNLFVQIQEATSDRAPSELEAVETIRPTRAVRCVLVAPYCPTTFSVGLLASECSCFSSCFTFFAY